MASNQLFFNSQTSQKKPVTITSNQSGCPFCQREELANILRSEGPILLVENKFKTLQNTLQTVLIETDHCTDELSTYTKSHLYQVIQFALDNWLHYVNSGDYQSVLLFKNHGPLSGGTIRHPHMQIVGLETVDYRENINPKHYEGLLIAKSQSVEFNLSTQPKVGFYEFNIVMEDLDDIQHFADYIQMATHFLLHHFHFKCESYNLFFYQVEHQIICKVIPRFVTTPLYIGYSIPQVSDDIGSVVNRIREIYM